MFSVPVRRPRDVRFSVPFLSFRLQAECFLLASNLSIWSFPALPIAFPNTFEFYWITAVYTQTQNNTTRMKRRRKKPIQPQTTPFPLRVIANLLIVMSVSGANCFKYFFLRARPIPLPLVLSYYVMGLNLMPCARRLCHNTALTAKHGNVINNTSFRRSVEAYAGFVPPITLLSIPYKSSPIHYWAMILILSGAV